MRSLLILVLVAVPSLASAQRTDLGTLRVVIGGSPRLRYNILIGAPEVPIPDPAELPFAAREVLARWQSSGRATMEEIRAVQSGTLDEAAIAQRRAHIDALLQRADADADTLRALLANETSPSRGALLLLGHLEYEAVTRHVMENSDYIDSPDFGLTMNAAIDAWAAIDGDDATAAYAALYRAHALPQIGRYDEARDALRAAAAMSLAPPDIAARALYHLGEIEEDLRAAADAFEQAMARDPVLHAEATYHAAWMRASLGEHDRALTLISTLPLGAAAGTLGAAARMLAAALVVRAGARGVARAEMLPEPLRVHVLIEAASIHAQHMERTWAALLLDAAEPIASSAEARTAIAELRAQIAEGEDTPRAWMIRAATFCAEPGLGREPALGGAIDVVARVDARGRARVHAVVASRHGSIAELTSIARCLKREAPPPGVALRRMVIRTHLELSWTAGTGSSYLPRVLSY